MNIALWIAQVLLAVGYLMLGGIKTFQIEKAREIMKFTQGRSDTFIRFVGVSEMLGGLGLILPIATGILPFLTPLAAIGLSIIQLLAIFTDHLPKKEYRDLLVQNQVAFSVMARWAS